ncbi:MAG TPA: cyclic nucleotide-binding domain-containing protein [Nevskia sp.]|jgi:CRP-like cAMP-binding protein|nr:cyclic nucleotide-binding domain-containing protein [Nevskia sp.]
MLVHSLVHLGYSLMLCALLARDVLWLRVLLVLAQASLSLYSWFEGFTAIAAWNALFVCINILWVVKILRERRAVRLPPELAAIHARHFAVLDPAEFLRLWSWGQRQRLPDGAALTHRGLAPRQLYFLLGGTVRVLQAGVELTRLSAGDFVAEMSLLTGEGASADAVAAGGVELIGWPVERLREVQDRNAVLWTKIQGVLGRDLVAKIQRAGR